MNSHLSLNPALLHRAAELISSADALLIGAGAGMSADSGLPVYRGDNGLWNNKLYLDGRVLDWQELSTPHLFHQKPQKIWGYYGRATQNLRTTEPHAGYHILKKWMDRFGPRSFVLTSNVDHQFLKAGVLMDQLVEIHGNLLYHQCVKPCGPDIWASTSFQPTVTLEPEIALTSPMPTCPNCGATARPNVLLFQDFQWQPARAKAQKKRYEAWLQTYKSSPLVVIEIGAGDVLANVRKACEATGAPIIRINPNPGTLNENCLSLPWGALETLTALDELV